VVIFRVAYLDNWIHSRENEMCGCKTKSKDNYRRNQQKHGKLIQNNGAGFGAAE
jgi:hypothetical protein